MSEHKFLRECLVRISNASVTVCLAKRPSRSFRNYPCKQILTRLSTNFESYRHLVAFLKIFCFSDTRFDGHNVAAIFGKQGRLPIAVADPNMYRNHSPAIRHESYYGFQVAALLRRNGNEVPWGGAVPVPNFAVELDVHCYSISHAQRCALPAGGRDEMQPF